MAMGGGVSADASGLRSAQGHLGVPGACGFVGSWKLFLAMFVQGGLGRVAFGSNVVICVPAPPFQPLRFSLPPPHTPIWEMDTREFIHNQYHIRLNICGVLKQRGALPTFSIRSKNRESALAATWVTDSVRRLLVTLLRPATRVCSKSRGVTPGDAGLLSHVSWIGPVSALRVGPAAPRSSAGFLRTRTSPKIRVSLPPEPRETQRFSSSGREAAPRPPSDGRSARREHPPSACAVGAAGGRAARSPPCVLKTS